VSSFFNNLGRSRVADYDTRRGFSPSTRVATPSRFSLPRDFGVEDLSQYAEEDLPGAIYRNEEDPFAPTASNTTSARVTPWNLIFPTRTESPLPRTPLPIARTSLPESYERTCLASPASTLSLDALAQAAAVAPRSVTPELQYPDPLEVTQPQEEEVPSENTFGPLSRSASPSYHVRTRRRKAPYPALRRLWLSLLRRVHHQASCGLCRRRHLLQIKRTFAPPLRNLLRHLSIHIFLQRAYKTRRRSTRTSTTSSSLTDNRFGDLLVKARSRLS
jgi:hypothetical protein